MDTLPLISVYAEGQGNCLVLQHPRLIAATTHMFIPVQRYVQWRLLLSKVFVEAFQRRRRSVWSVRRHLCRKVSSIDLHRCLTARLVNCGICACRVYALVSDDICAISLDILVSYFLGCIYCRVPCIYHKATFSTLPTLFSHIAYQYAHIAH